MLLKGNDRIVFAGNSVMDDARKRPNGEGLWDGTRKGSVRIVDPFLDRLERDIVALKPDWAGSLIIARAVLES